MNEVIIPHINVGHSTIGDRGAVKGSYIENEMAQATCKGMYDSFVSHGVKATIEKGDLSIDADAKVANSNGSNMMLSVHYNAGGGDRGEVIHSIRKDGSKELADIIALGLKDAGQTAVKVYPYPNPKAPNFDFFGILRTAKMKACLIEICFIDNATDIKQFDTWKEQYDVGVKIARRIMAYYGIIK